MNYFACALRRRCSRRRRRRNIFKHHHECFGFGYLHRFDHNHDNDPAMLRSTSKHGVDSHSPGPEPTSCQVCLTTS